MLEDDPNLLNKVQFIYKSDDSYLHRCEMDLTPDIADIILDQLEDIFSVELAVGSITHHKERVKISFAASREKLRSLQKALVNIISFQDRMN